MGFAYELRLLEVWVWTWWCLDYRIVMGEYRSLNVEGSTRICEDGEFVKLNCLMPIGLYPFRSSIAVLLIYGHKLEMDYNKLVRAFGMI